MKRLTWFLLSIALVFALSACGQTPASAPTSTPLPPINTPQPPTATSAPTDTPAPTATPTHAAGPVTTGAINDFKVTLEGDILVISFGFSNKSTDYNAFHVFIDTDQSSKTGYKVSGAGADLMIENATIFTYNGDGSSWGWQQVQAPNLEYEVAETAVSWKVPLAELGMQKGKAADFVAQLVNTNWDAVATTMKMSVDLK